MTFVSVIGAGTMGNGIAHVFAQHGFKVTLVDISPAQLEKAVATIGKNLDRMISKEIIRKELKVLLIVLSISCLTIRNFLEWTPYILQHGGHTS